MPTTVIARPGNVGSHHAVMTYSRDSAIMAPHSGVGGWTPRPRKLSEAPARMFSTAADIAKTTGMNKELTDDRLSAAWGVGAIPGGPANGPSAGSSDHQTVVFGSSKNKPAALKFMRYLASDEYAIKNFLLRNGDLPAVQGLERKIPELNNPITLGFVKIGALVITPPYGPKYEEAYPPIMSNIQRTYSTSDPVADIARAMQTQLLQVYGK
jgi:ABC-type glycerol-3-phosphate transport system substrate-binding protein